MDNVPQPKLYFTPQEKWFFKGSTPDVFPEHGDKTTEYFLIPPFSEVQMGARRGNAALVEEQNRVRREKGYEIFNLPMIEGLNITAKLNLGQNEVIALKLQELDGNGMTKDDPEFAIGTWNKDEGQLTNTRDITPRIYSHYEEGEKEFGIKPQPTYREERRSLTSAEGNMTGGPENKG